MPLGVAERDNLYHTLFGQVGKLTHKPGIQQRAQRVMHRLQLQTHQRIVQICHSPPVKMIREPVPGLLRGRG